jgi:AAA15 family ATPase/GTPase
MFYIKSVRAISESGEVSSVSFGPHLNIIYGPSNCGKTMILKCIDYLLGAREDPLIKKKFKIATVEMDLFTSHGSVKLSRDISSKNATVISENSFLKSGTYNLSHTNASKLTYGQALLGLFDIEQTDPIKIFATKKATTGNMSVRQFVGTFIVKEEPIISENNIYIDREANITTLKTSLLYLLSGETHITGKEQTPEWVSKKKAMKKYYEKQIDDLVKDNGWLDMKVCEGAEITIAQNADNSVDQLDADFKDLQAKFVDANSKSASISGRVISLSAEIAKKDYLLQRDNELREHYVSDVERTKFIVDGAVAISGVEQPTNCPYCNAPLKKEKVVDYIETSSHVLGSIVPKMDDLDKEIAQLKLEKSSLEKELDAETKNQEAITNLISNDIQPKMDDLKAKIRAYGNACREAEKKTLLRSQYDKFLNDKEAVDKELKEAITSFEPDEYFGDFGEKVTNRLKTVLTECHFINGDIARFDIPKFDVFLGSDPKGGSGKGYRAFLNSACSFALHSELQSRINCGSFPFIIDSPILSLREKRKEVDEEDYEESAQGMKRPLFEFFYNNSKNSQTIVIENNVPDFDKGDTNMIEFTLNPDDPEHYGFIVGFRPKVLKNQ